MRLRWILCAVFLAACQQKGRAPDAVVPAHGSVYEVQIGKQVYMHYCTGCHGDTGAGDGFNSFNLDPHPRDLGDPKFQKSKTNADLADAIKRGGSGVGLSSLMPPWGRTLDARQTDDVILYVRSLKRGL
jgi:mono/diheme cytochrome c family protein